MPTLSAGSILLGSPRAAELRTWYRSVLAPDAPSDGPIHLGQLMLVIDQRDDLAVANDEPGRSILNFHIEDFASAKAQLEEAGVHWTAPPEERPSGWFATFADPDGNYLQIIQFKQSPRDLPSSGRAQSSEAISDTVDTARVAQKVQPSRQQISGGRQHR